MTFSVVLTSTLSSGDVWALYRQMSAGEAIVTAILLCLLIVELADLVRSYA